jgi:hypothetical protein
LWSAHILQIVPELVGDADLKIININKF